MYLRDFFALKPFHDYSLCSVCILPQPAFYSQSAVCSLHFTRSLHFTHGPQSAYYAGRFENVMERGTSKNLTSVNLETASKIFWKLNLEVLVISRRLKLP